MHKKVRLRKKNKHKTRNIIILILIALAIAVSICFNLIDKKAMPIFMEYATSKTTRLATLIITSAVDNEVFKNMDTNDLFIIEKDSNNNIKYIDFDSLKINKLLNLITNSVDTYIRNVENGNLDKIDKNIESEYKYEDLKRGIIYEIPSGIVFQNSFLSNLGPKIPVRMNLVGDVITDVNTNLKSYGINNALVNIDVNVTVSIKVILPFKSNTISTTTNIPIAMKLIQGEVPNYYYSPLTSS